MRNKIKLCIDEFVAMEERMAAKLNKLDNGSSAPSAPGLDLDEETPSAPSLDTEDDPSSSAPSAPAMIQAFHTPECVVCLEKKVTSLVANKFHVQQSQAQIVIYLTFT